MHAHQHLHTALFFSTVLNTVLLGGESPTDPAAEQVGLTTVQVSWTAPSVPPSNGYRITTNPSSASTNAQASPHIITISTPGVYDIQVMSLSQHYPGVMVELQGFIVRGEGYIMIAY